MIARPTILTALRDALRRNPVVVLTGPRQSGKTTLARQLLPADSVNYFDLEDPPSLARLDEPMTALRPLVGLVVIDEVQRRPDLFPLLRVLADRQPQPARFLILGSASGDLLRQTSESLTGRAESITIDGFSLAEVGADALATLWRRGRFPRSFLAATEQDSLLWRNQFVLSLLERDFPQWGVRVPATTMRRFWTIVAHYHAQTWNAATAASTLGVTQPTVRNYLDLLSDAYMIRQLQPWHANLTKRQVRSPKVYVRDSGLLHSLLGITTEKSLLTHPALGTSWEGFAIEQVLATEPHDAAYFWATYQGAEVDLLIEREGRLLGVECKRTDTPRVTPSIRIALAELGLDRVAVVYPGEQRFPLAEKVEAVPLQDLASGRRILADEVTP